MFDIIEKIGFLFFKLFNNERVCLGKVSQSLDAGNQGMVPDNNNEKQDSLVVNRDIHSLLDSDPALSNSCIGDSSDIIIQTWEYCSL